MGAECVQRRCLFAFGPLNGGRMRPAPVPVCRHACVAESGKESCNDCVPRSSKRRRRAYMQLWADRVRRCGSDPGPLPPNACCRTDRAALGKLRAASPVCGIERKRENAMVSAQRFPNDSGERALCLQTYDASEALHAASFANDENGVSRVRRCGARSETHGEDCR